MFQETEEKYRNFQGKYKIKHLHIISVNKKQGHEMKF